MSPSEARTAFTVTAVLYVAATLLDGPNSTRQVWPSRHTLGSGQRRDGVLGLQCGFALQMPLGERRIVQDAHDGELIRCPREVDVMAVSVVTKEAWTLRHFA